MGFFVYVIYSAKLDKYYTGYTDDINRRLSEHNMGVSDFTSSASDWVLRHKERFEIREDAMKREREIKKKKSRKYLEFLIGSCQ